MARTRARPRTPPAAVKLIARDHFLRRVWDYEAGNHVSFIAPTQSGKTYLANQLITRSVAEDLPGYMLVMKRKDKTVADFLEAQDRWRRTTVYPPPPSPRRKPLGWVVWPHHTADPDADDVRMERIFRELLRDRYVKGDSIVFADEVQGLVEEMHLTRELIRIWARGASEGCGMWAATQRPYMAPQHMYSQAEHLFIAYTPDKRDQDRFAEIGGVDPDQVRDVVMKLPQYYWLYIRRSKRQMCVVGP